MMKTTTVTIVVCTFLGATALGFYVYNRQPIAPITLTGSCDGSSSDHYCAPIVGCFDGSDVTFIGRANGYIRGEIIGQLSSSAKCSGNWVANPAQSGGIGQVDCDDGNSISVNYHNYDRSNWIIIGKGLNEDGRIVYAVSSSPAFRRNQKPLSEKGLMRICRSLLASDQ